MVRQVVRIANWYGWQAEIARAMDAERVSTLQDLDDRALQALHDRMIQLEECVQTGGGAPDAPPAW